MDLPLQFEWPWLLWLIPLPLLVHWFIPPVVSANDAVLRVPFLNDFGSEGVSTSGTVAAGRWLLWVALLAWALLVIASARPQWQGEAVELPVSGRDLMLAVDLSGSMEVEDFEWQGRMVNRLVAIQLVAGEFIERRVGDRVGLVLFGQQAYLQTPLTFDRTTVKTLLDEAVIGLAGQATAIGDAIGLAVKRLREDSNTSRVLILLTDGANTAGEIEPLKAAELAASEGLKIYTIGIGADEMMVRSLFGSRKVNPSVDLDEETLNAIATTTGGRYFRARDLAQLDEIYQLLDELEPVEQEKQFFRPRHSLYHWPLGAAMLIATILLWRQARKQGAA
ncbi:MAG: VWA domain-containing protein [Gammaproteobacteria bacterium]|nr:VWA domain-containing protein [Gammaproteobacteria bacterium]